MVNVIWQNKVLNADESEREYREKNQVISFADEKHFLDDTIRKYDEFYEEIKLFGLDKKDGSLQIYAVPEKAVHIVLISATGLQKNEHAFVAQKVIPGEALFAEPPQFT